MGLDRLGAQSGADQGQATILQAWLDIELGIGPVTYAPAVTEQIGDVNQDGAGRGGRTGWCFVMSADRIDDSFRKSPVDGDKGR